jgi:hypothetical protein
MRLHPKWRPGMVGTMVAVPAAIFLAACSSTSTTSPSTSSSTSSTAPSTTSSSTAATASGTFDSCSVVNPGEASGAIGAMVGPGVHGSATVEGGVACVFYGPSAPTPHTPDSPQPDTVRVVVVKGSDAATWYANYKTYPGVVPVALSGYGDQAYWDGHASISILKGSDYLRIAVSPAGGVPSETDEEKLATAILPSLS